MTWKKLFRLFWEYLIKEYDNYVMVYLRGNYILCIRYFYFFETGFDMENNRRREILSCR